MHGRELGRGFRSGLCLHPRADSDSERWPAVLPNRTRPQRSRLDRSQLQKNRAAGHEAETQARHGHKRRAGTAPRALAVTQGDCRRLFWTFFIFTRESVVITANQTASAIHRMSEAAGRRERGALRALGGEAQMAAQARPEGTCGHARRRLFSGLINFYWGRSAPSSSTHPRPPPSVQSDSAKDRKPWTRSSDDYFVMGQEAHMVHRCPSPSKRTHTRTESPPKATHTAAHASPSAAAVAAADDDDDSDRPGCSAEKAQEEPRPGRWPRMRVRLPFARSP